LTGLEGSTQPEKSISKSEVARDRRIYFF